ncbi:MAG: DUF2683 family protein [Candidatus Diapherotrites archaeon]|uniref:DUF2683 family protein n=1 Tax=Candidatus Iainarchaeum sp. TaxID=3101447 RepID=A0A7J4JU84_9ARCH|nr:DUF2683 family protein [Candidatus Diapherotrites archaeon]HIH21341.1 DUF2683 family protein [Candidatus Diapherotrites archaeon]
MPVARVVLGSYANTVLNVIKAKYDLKDKSQALNKFIELYGPEEVEPKVKESFVKKILKIEENYFKKYGNSKRMNPQELDELFETKK